MTFENTARADNHPQDLIRFSVERNVLVHALSRCGSIVESKTIISILSHILIEASMEGTLK
jgi:DNA polymerase III sliding clamp (beta) subunit (PCNA family)